MSENRSTWVVAAGIPFFYSSIRALGVCRVAWPMWVVRECEGCPICLRESFGELGSRWKRFPVETNPGQGSPYYPKWHSSVPSQRGSA